MRTQPVDQLDQDQQFSFRSRDPSFSINNISTSSASMTVQTVKLHHETFPNNANTHVGHNLVDMSTIYS